MMLPLSTEFWVIVQLVVDLCLIVMFVVFIRQVKADGRRSGDLKMPDEANSLESVLRDARDVAKQFDVQLKEKQHIVSRLNERLDSRIISLNLLLNRAEASLDSGQNVLEKNATSHKDVNELQRQVLALDQAGLGPGKIAGRLGIAKGEVALVLDLKRKFREMEQNS